MSARNNYSVIFRIKGNIIFLFKISLNGCERDLNSQVIIMNPDVFVFVFNPRE